MSPAVYFLIAFLCVAIFLLAIFVWRARSSAHPALDLMQRQVEALRGELAQNLKNSSDSLSGEVRSLAQSLQRQMDSVQGRLVSGMDSSARVVQEVSQKIGELSQGLTQVSKMGEAMGREISSLQAVFQPPKMRGGIGEVMLENLLAEVLPREHYEPQYRFKNREQVDAVIKLPEGLVPVDAKFPLDNFRRMLETADEGSKSSFRKQFIKDVKKQIDDISRKYILPDEGTLDFAMMYIPAENVYYETILRGEDGEQEIYNYAMERKVFPVSPNSFYAYLAALVRGFRGMKLARQAREIWEHLARLSGDLQRFSEEFALVGKHLSNAQKSFTDAEKRLGRFSEKLASLKEGTPSALPPPEKGEG